MFTIKKHFHLITMLCFLTASLSLQHLWAEERFSKKTLPDQQNAEEKKEIVPTQNQPQISLDSTQYDAGEVYEGDVIVHAFTVRNTGTAQLNIEKVKAG